MNKPYARFALSPLLATTLLALAFPAHAQLQRGEAPTAEQIQAGEAPATIVPEKERAARELEAQMAALRWTRPAVQELLDYVMRVNEEGLDPADYAPERLRAALAGADDLILSTAATDTFLRLSSDLAMGHVRGDNRLDWHFPDEDLDAKQQYDLMQRAITNNSVRDTLTSLLPTHPQYIELKAMYASATDKATRDKVRINLDRWRWLPRDLGKRYVIVNVPRFTVALVEDGNVIARHKVVVGKPTTATPQLNAVATGVIFNPWWEVPASIADEVKGKKGYVSVKTGERIHYRQPPGPRNALGQMKVVMPNNYAIYLHDTPSKTLFDRSVRAFSHGCIRTHNAIGFAETLLGNPKWDRAAIDKALASGKTVKADTIVPTPVYITYFTAVALADGKGIETVPDIYSRDKPVLAALDDREGETKMAASPPAIGTR